ncbi:hypothetical protein PP633_21520 [Mycobacteroides abscessus]|uniref:hypothetical protein n=1 Tax=Mycobacteroides abscessus TaxID=36809 RepID=UPI0005E9427F|nr:hypothetical protein [Mycobacteroides abscessus]MBN7316075.1 hypothetical protein [Mycobacteroides abscessus subsp. massiliense]MDM2646139.1 hypothetical protein [Mycobacteroides abscessus]MDM2655117.1 hypothetical protein [Mycobacteroides abscessus]MDM2665101.1 hypothetical protein [Mycobacteroides abscessus]MDM2670930.1 hypothetical protein [Mycobacteroides abscessus]
MGEPATRADAFLRVATIAFVIGWALDAVDHLRRGFAAAPLTLTCLAATHAVLIAVAVTMILRHRRHAPEATVIVGSASVLGLGYVHLMPSYWPSVQDSFVSGPRVDVTWFSWVTMLISIAAAVVWAHAGSRALILRD